MGKFICNEYRGHLIRRHYCWDTLWWAEKDGKRVIFGSTEERLKKRLDRLLEKS